MMTKNEQSQWKAMTYRLEQLQRKVESLSLARDMQARLIELLCGKLNLSDDAKDDIVREVRAEFKE